MTGSGGKRPLQLAVALLGLSPTGFGAAGVLTGLGYFDVVDRPAVDLDSQFRFLSGIFMGVGLVAYTCIPSIERKTDRVRIVGAVIFLGGLGRLLSLLVAGAPSTSHLVGLGLELVAVPVLIVWQARVSRSMRSVSHETG